MLRCGASASNRKGECGGGVVYQRHRRTLMAKLKGQLQYEVSTKSCRCTSSILRTGYSFSVVCCAGTRAVVHADHSNSDGHIYGARGVV